VRPNPSPLFIPGFKLPILNICHEVPERGCQSFTRRRIQVSIVLQHTSTTVSRGGKVSLIHPLIVRVEIIVFARRSFSKVNGADIFHKNLLEKGRLRAGPGGGSIAEDNHVVTKVPTENIANGVSCQDGDVCAQSEEPHRGIQAGRESGRGSAALPDASTHGGHHGVDEERWKCVGVRIGF